MLMQCWQLKLCDLCEYSLYTWTQKYTRTSSQQAANRFILQTWSGTHKNVWSIAPHSWHSGICTSNQTKWGMKRKIASNWMPFENYPMRWHIKEYFAFANIQSNFSTSSKSHLFFWPVVPEKLPEKLRHFFLVSKSHKLQANENNSRQKHSFIHWKNKCVQNGAKIRWTDCIWLEFFLRKEEGKKWA